MSLVELIAQADERGLAVSGLACLDRCLPLLGGDEEVLRPLWAELADGGDVDDWGVRIAQARDKLGDAGPAEAAGDEAALLAHRMLVAARQGSPLAIGHGQGEMFVGSDALALSLFTDRITYLDEGDWAVVTPEKASIYSRAGAAVERLVHLSQTSSNII